MARSPSCWARRSGWRPRVLRPNEAAFYALSFTWDGVRPSAAAPAAQAGVATIEVER
jgi:hypothetical protein